MGGDTVPAIEHLKAERCWRKRIGKRSKRSCSIWNPLRPSLMLLLRRMMICPPRPSASTTIPHSLNAARMTMSSCGFIKSNQSTQVSLRQVRLLECLRELPRSAAVSVRRPAAAASKTRLPQNKFKPPSHSHPLRLGFATAALRIVDDSLGALRGCAQAFVRFKKYLNLWNPICAPQQSPEIKTCGLDLMLF